MKKKVVIGIAVVLVLYGIVVSTFPKKEPETGQQAENQKTEQIFGGGVLLTQTLKNQ